MDVVVVGAGICGLATAFELRQRGLRVEVVEAEGVGAGQSAGEARIRDEADDSVREEWSFPAPPQSGGEDPRDEERVGVGASGRQSG